MNKEPDLSRRKFLKDTARLTGGLTASVLTGTGAQASDRITQMLRDTDPMRRVVLDLGKKLSKYASLLPNKFKTNREAEGAVDKLMTEYLNIYALTNRALQPEQRTSEYDVEALKYAVDELRQHKGTDISVLKYLYDLLIAEQAKALHERENNPRPSGPEREAQTKTSMPSA
ncbi:hypothetical protein HY971_02670 [Candidatus Kaiserbacteria bacterium]|nr:hypothetical protein [Candidatus Kaiserbacteria bacterium]